LDIFRGECLLTNREKRRGEIGPIKMTTGSTGVSAIWEKIALPKGKAELEQFYADRFVAALNKQKLLPDMVIKNIRQNPENSLDFTLETSKGEKWLELMEIAPFEFFSVSPAEVPTSYKPYDVGQFLHGKIMKKSSSYQSSNIFLLLYLTDWRFQPSETVIALLQFWCNRESHSFEAIFCYMSLTDAEGHLWLIAPTPTQFWDAFDPEAYRENKTVNLDPTKWQVGGVTRRPD
jgi:hypothetical protein